MNRSTLAILVLLAACGKDDDTDKDKGDDTTVGDTDTDAADTDVTVTPEPGTLVKDLQPGDCGAPVEDSLWVERFLVVEDCTLPHAYEVAGRYTVDHTTHPGHTALMMEGRQQCRAIFEAHVGKAYWDSVYDLTTISPSIASWANGDRDVVCLVKTVNRTPLTEKAQGSGR